MKRGGTLILASGAATPELQNLTGVSISREQRVGRAWRWVDDDGDNNKGKEGVALRSPHTTRGGDSTSFRQETFLYTPILDATEDLSAVQVVMEAPNGDALAVSHSLGQGRVVLCLIPWFEGYGGKPLADSAEALLSRLAFRDVAPVSVAGPWQLMVSTMRNYPSQNCATVSLSNNDASPWSGDVVMHRLLERLPTETSEPRCVELLSERNVIGRKLATSRGGLGEDVVVEITIGAFDVAVLQCCLA